MQRLQLPEKTTEAPLCLALVKYQAILFFLLQLGIYFQLFLSRQDEKKDEKWFTSTSHAYSDPSRSVTLHCIFFGFLTIFRGDLESLLDDDFWESLSSSSCWYSSCFALAAANSCSLSVAYKEKEQYFLKWDEAIATQHATHPAPERLSEPSLGHGWESPWCRTESPLPIEKISCITHSLSFSLQKAQNTCGAGARMNIL